MSLFGKKKVMSADIGKVWDVEPETVVNYNSVLEFLTGLSDTDFDKVIKVAQIYRQADKDAAQELEITPEVTSFINMPPPTIADSSFTDEAGNIDLALLDDEPKPKAKKVVIN